MQEVVADQIADVGMAQRCACLDEEVVPEELDVGVHDIGLLGHDAQEIAQRESFALVALTVQRRASNCRVGRDRQCRCS